MADYSNLPRALPGICIPGCSTRCRLVPAAGACEWRSKWERPGQCEPFRQAGCTINPITTDLMQSDKMNVRRPKVLFCLFLGVLCVLVLFSIKKHSQQYIWFFLAPVFVYTMIPLKKTVDTVMFIELKWHPALSFCKEGVLCMYVSVPHHRFHLQFRDFSYTYI